MARRIGPWIGILSALVLAWLAYRPGLSGGFLFDDFVNLDALGATGPVDDWPTFWRYVTSGSADPTGRPLSLLSFLLDARDWPANPRPFLVTNVVLHLCNGLLLYLVVARLERFVRGQRDGAEWVAALAAACWTLHPLWVSTTLYIVQRHAMLPMAFSLLGLLSYIHGRERLQSGTGGLAFMVGGIGLGTALAMLCKANGVLLPLLALALEATVFAGRVPQGDRARRGLRWFHALAIGVPALFVLVFLLGYAGRLDQIAEGRDWTIGQRLLTQPRVIADYLSLLVAPRVVSTGLYNDAYVLSSSLVMPWTTLPAILLVLGLASSAIAWRRRYPRYSAAVLFFFSGHLLESTVVPLELYFEHRNYLPAALMFWPLAGCLCALVRPRVAVSAGIFVVALLAFVTWQRASLWGDPDQLALAWAKRNPGSSRALATEAMVLARRGQVDEARRRLGSAWESRPADAQLGLNWVEFACRSGGLSASGLDRLDALIRSPAGKSALTYDWLLKAMDAAETGQCPGLDFPAMQRLAESAARTLGTATPSARIATEQLRGTLALKRGRGDTALQHFNRALAESPGPEAAGRNAAALASAGFLREALAHLDAYAALEKKRAPTAGRGMPRLHRLIEDRQDYWGSQLRELRRDLEAAQRQSSAEDGAK